MSIVEAIFAVFTEIGDWIVTAFTQLIPIFWNATDSNLTFMGVLAVVSLGINVILLNFGHYISDNICESPLTAGNSY